MYTRINVVVCLVNVIVALDEDWWLLQLLFICRKVPMSQYYSKAAPTAKLNEMSTEY